MTTTASKNVSKMLIKSVALDNINEYTETIFEWSGRTEDDLNIQIVTLGMIAGMCELAKALCNKLEEASDECDD